jgi:hypothetical protein
MNWPLTRRGSPPSVRQWARSSGAAAFAAGKGLSLGEAIVEVLGEAA